MPWTSYADWCREHDCDHGHCPAGCEKPQPFVEEESGRLVCGRCAVYLGELRDMIPCTPDTCD